MPLKRVKKILLSIIINKKNCSVYFMKQKERNCKEKIEPLTFIPVF